MSEDTDTNNIIQETSDYSIFKVLPHNRTLVHNHVRDLAHSLAERPHLRPARPILVNEKYQVIDGQHRLKASELNGQSVYFMVVPGLAIGDARLLNALQRTWGLLDYAYSYASSKVPAYVQFVDTYEAHTLPPSIILDFMRNNKEKAYDFRAGNLEVVDQKQLDLKLGRAEEILSYCIEHTRAYTLAASFLAIQKIEGYDHNRMLKKIGDQKIGVQADRVNYIREFERIYNTDIPYNGPSYLRFF